MASENVVRGQADSPLNPQGRAEAKRLGSWLAARGGLTCVYMSSAKRAVETAAALNAACPATELEDPAKDLLSWSLGGLEGEPGIEADPKIAAYVRYLPDVAPEGRGANGQRGESFDAFRWRALPYIGQQCAEWLRNPKLKIGIVAHHRVARLLKAWITGGMSPFYEIDKAEFTKPYELGQPSSCWLLAPVRGDKNGSWGMTLVDPASRAALVPGVYFMRHASTKLNSGGSASGLDGKTGES